MNAATFFSDAPAPSSATPVLTRRTVERQLWREEWRRHRMFLCHSLALWAWLFLVPGWTTHAEYCPLWSVLWAGLLALKVGVHDLQHGVDPLVRVLAPPMTTRWSLRVSFVILFTGVFFTAGWMASHWQWAGHLWSLVGDGSFTGLGRQSYTIIPPHYGMSVACFTGVLGLMVASRTTKVWGVLLYAVLIGMIALVMVVDHGMLIRALRYLTFGEGTRSREWEPALKWGGVILLVMTGILWGAGAWLYARRPPLASTMAAEGTSRLWIGLGIAVTSWLGLIVVTSRWWDDETGLAILMVAWFWLARPWRKHRPPKRWRWWLGRVCLVSMLGVAGWQVWRHVTTSVLPIAQELEGEWPPPAENLSVIAAEPYDSSSGFYSATTMPEVYDVIVWIHYPGEVSRPVSIAQTSLLIDESIQSGNSWELNGLSLPGSMPGWENIHEFLAKVRVWPETTGSGQRRNATQLVFEISVESLGPPPQPIWVQSSSTLKVFYSETAFRADSAYGAWPLLHRHVGRPPAMMLGALVLPRKVGTDLSPWSMSQFLGKPRDLVLNGRPRHSVVYQSGGFGIQGLWHHPWIGLNKLLLPMLAALLAIGAYVRPSALAQLGLVCALLLVLIWADGVRSRKEAEIALDARHIKAQREYARAFAESSYFHDWRARLRWVGQEK